MHRIYLLLILTNLTTLVFGQSEKINDKNVADNFEHHYNANNFDSIFSSFSPEMQKALPITQTKEFLTGLKLEVGKIIQREFYKYENTYAVYKTNFESALFAVNISVDNNSKINGLFLEPFKGSHLPKTERNITKLILPFKDTWTVVWGGDTKELNYHVETQAQKYAFDILKTNEQGMTFKTNGKSNDDYFAFGKDIIAPCDGEVVLVVDGINDNLPGKSNPVYAPGNSVIIKTENNEFLFFGHLKQHSIVVKQGQKIKKQELIGLCGNSGNSSEPHLHFHIQNTEDINSATGIKCFFDKIQLNGKVMANYSPIQKDKISN